MAPATVYRRSRQFGGYDNDHYNLCTKMDTNLQGSAEAGRGCILSNGAPTCTIDNHDLNHGL